MVAPGYSLFEATDSALLVDTPAMAQPMSVAIHAARRGDSGSGQLVVVTGVGGIGLFLALAAVEAGAEVWATDIDPFRLELAARLGADLVLTRRR